LQPFITLSLYPAASQPTSKELISVFSESKKGNSLNEREKLKQKERILPLSFILYKAVVHTQKHEVPKYFGAACYLSLFGSMI
jgi:hypothetical protein